MINAFKAFLSWRGFEERRTTRFDIFQSFYQIIASYSRNILMRSNWYIDYLYTDWNAIFILKILSSAFLMRIGQSYYPINNIYTSKSIYSAFRAFISHFAWKCFSATKYVKYCRIIIGNILYFLIDIIFRHFHRHLWRYCIAASNEARLHHGRICWFIFKNLARLASMLEWWLLKYQKLIEYGLSFIKMRHEKDSSILHCWDILHRLLSCCS